MATTIALVSLGCSKNLVDSEHMLGVLSEKGYEILEETDGANVIIVNSCAFIRPAEEEAIEALLDLAELKKRKKGPKIICTGCLPQRRGEALKDLLPEVDGFVGIGAIQQMPDVVERVLGGERVFVGSDFAYSPTAETPRWRSAPQWSTYLRIADGCSNFCTYCTIPEIRGPYRSRGADDIVAEFRKLAGSGIREVCLNAQDTTAWGRDLPSPRPDLADLLKALGQVEYDGWLRLLYMHPEHLSDKLLETMASLPQLVHYIDLPLQHVSKGVLFRMGRRGSKQEILELVGNIRAAMPDVAIRTTFITGFPQETEGEFESLLEFLQEAQLDRVSAFRFWPEEGTPAASMVNQIPEEVGDDRLARLMALQEGISLQVNQRLVGRTLRVLLEESVDDIWKGRSYRDAPEVDGEVKVIPQGRPGLEAGQFIDVKITRAEVHDLEGEPAE
ncbi:MAG: 30S ribosomal protein S12 methylthiotransferase RimO [Armatimonadota bacterium]